MPWYKTGTVNVQSNTATVTGNNTNFASNSRVGDAFRGPDGNWYEVVNVTSDTVLSISPNYQGANNAAGAYALAPMQGYVKDSADSLRALVNQFGDKMAALGTTGNYDVLPVAKGGTGRSDGRVAVSELGVQQAAVSYGGQQGMYMGWNGTDAAPGAGNFVVNRGDGAGGFSWRSVNSGNTATGPTMTYAYDGTLTVPFLSISRAPLAVASGGTGGNTQALARAGLGLGTAAVASLTSSVTDTDEGKVLKTGDFGLGAIANPMATSMNTWACGFYAIQGGNTQYIPNGGSGNMIAMGLPFGKTRGSQIYMTDSNFIGFRSGDYASATFNTIYHTGNTSRSSDGTLKAI